MIYLYACERCGARKEEFRKVIERNNCPNCDQCGTVMQKQITACGVQPDFQPYYDDNLQSVVKSRRHRQTVMREQGVSEKFGKGWI